MPSLVALVITFFDNSSGTVGVGRPDQSVGRPYQSVGHLYQSVVCFNCLTDLFASG